MAGFGGFRMGTPPPAPPSGVTTPAPQQAAPTQQLKGTKGTALAPPATPEANVISGRRVPPQYYQQVAAMAANAERSGKAPESKFQGDVEAYMNDHGIVLHT